MVFQGNTRCARLTGTRLPRSIANLARFYALPVMAIMRQHGLHAVVARNLRAMRAANRMRQADVADATAGRLTRHQIAAIETGTRKVDLDDLPAICQALGVGLVELLAGSDQEARAARRRLRLERAPWLTSSGMHAARSRNSSGFGLDDEATSRATDLVMSLDDKQLPALAAAAPSEPLRATCTRQSFTETAANRTLESETLDQPRARLSCSRT
jgi:transcriptional regulator with XRE-family HTH domain